MKYDSFEAMDLAIEMYGCNCVSCSTSAVISYDEEETDYILNDEDDTVLPDATYNDDKEYDEDDRFDDDERD